MQNYIVEFLGTTLLAYVILTVGHPIAIALALLVALLLGSKKSGGHFNPAITIMMFAGGRFSIKNVLPYILAQCLGALTALQLHHFIRL